MSSSVISAAANTVAGEFQKSSMRALDRSVAKLGEHQPLLLNCTTSEGICLEGLLDRETLIVLEGHRVGIAASPDGPDADSSGVPLSREPCAVCFSETFAAGFVIGASTDPAEPDSTWVPPSRELGSVCLPKADAIDETFDVRS